MSVKVPDTSGDDVIWLVDLIHKKWVIHLNTVPKAQMRGASGWVTPEVMEKKDAAAPIQWKFKGDLIPILTQSFQTLMTARSHTTLVNVQ